LPARIPEYELPRRERIELPHRMRSSGMSVASIADYLGVHWRTVYS
jgi:hypothetical protein